MKKITCISLCFLILCSFNACTQKAPVENTVSSTIAPQPIVPTETPATEATIPADSMQIIHPDTGEPVVLLKKYAHIFQLNTDMVGWIQIPDTKINYPVMQSPDSPNYYLSHNFQKEEFRAGSIYASEQANITESDNVILYGHNMEDGSMFAALHNYTSKEFYDANSYITFDSLYATHTYQIFAVFEINIYTDSFRYHTFTDGNIMAFKSFVRNCQKRALYDTGVEVAYGDKLLTLSTCDQDVTTNSGRFVVVAKLVS